MSFGSKRDLIWVNSSPGSHLTTAGVKFPPTGCCWGAMIRLCSRQTSAREPGLKIKDKGLGVQQSMAVEALQNRIDNLTMMNTEKAF